MEKKNKLLPQGIIMFFIGVMSFFLIEGLVIRPIVNHFGVITDGYIYMQSRKRGGMRVNHYYFKVGKKEYKGHTGGDYDTTICVKYLPRCPQIHYTTCKSHE